jgi:hypothetical protein
MSPVGDDVESGSDHSTGLAHLRAHDPCEDAVNALQLVMRERKPAITIS